MYLVHTWNYGCCLYMVNKATIYMQGANEWTYPILLSKILRSVFAHRIVYARTTIRWRRHMRHSEENNQNETQKKKQGRNRQDTHRECVFIYTCDRDEHSHSVEHFIHRWGRGGSVNDVHEYFVPCSVACRARTQQYIVHSTHTQRHAEWIGSCAAIGQITTNKCTCCP